MENVDNAYIVMPGYKLIIYKDINYTGGGYASGQDIMDNTSNTVKYYILTANENNTSSCRLYFNGAEVTLVGISDGGTQLAITTKTNTVTGTWITTPNIPSNIPFIYKGMPIYPGAYLINSGNGAHPIFCSIIALNNFGFNDQDNFYIIMPGYSLIVYRDPNYANNNTNNMFENCGSSAVVSYVNAPSSDNSSSCKLYFGNILDTSGIVIDKNEIRIQGISY